MRAMSSGNSSRLCLADSVATKVVRRARGRAHFQKVGSFAGGGPEGRQAQLVALEQGDLTWCPSKLNRSATAQPIAPPPITATFDI